MTPRVARIVLTILMVVLPGIASRALAQAGNRTQFMVSGGGGLVIRAERHATGGSYAGVGVTKRLSAGLSLRLEGTWQSFAPWQFSSGAPCPPGGCPAGNTNRTNLAGLALNVQYRKIGVGNPVYPVLGVGFLRFSEGRTTNESPSLNAGFGVGLGAWLSMEGRYHAILADVPAKGFLALTLVGSSR